MSDYRRLISYIYAYEGGVKGRNIGFAKLEARKGQCKIQVSVRKIYAGGQDVGVYMLTAGGEVLLGKMFLRNGAGEFRTAVTPGNVAGSGQGLDQCYGLTIHGVEDTWRSYTTIWEDAVAHAAELDLEEATVEKAEEREMQQLPPSEISEKTLEELRERPPQSVVDAIEAEIQAQDRVDKARVRKWEDISEEENVSADTGATGDQTEMREAISPLPGAEPAGAGPGNAGPGSAGPGNAGPGSAGPGNAGPGSADLGNVQTSQPGTVNSAVIRREVAEPAESTPQSVSVGNTGTDTGAAGTVEPMKFIQEIANRRKLQAQSAQPSVQQTQKDLSQSGQMSGEATVPPTRETVRPPLQQESSKEVRPWPNHAVPTVSQMRFRHQPAFEAASTQSQPEVVAPASTQRLRSSDPAAQSQSEAIASASTQSLYPSEHTAELQSQSEVVAVSPQSLHLSAHTAGLQSQSEVVAPASSRPFSSPARTVQSQPGAVAPASAQLLRPSAHTAEPQPRSGVVAPASSRQLSSSASTAQSQPEAVAPASTQSLRPSEHLAEPQSQSETVAPASTQSLRPSEHTAQPQLQTKPSVAEPEPIAPASPQSLRPSASTAGAPSRPEPAAPAPTQPPRPSAAPAAALPPHDAGTDPFEQQAGYLDRLDQEETGDPEEVLKLWHYFQRHYPKIRAFDYSGSCEVLVIKPQDIGLLPRETWAYGNNSFLLHGYYNHRYLILARLVGQKGEIRFLLGVPGHYYSNEKYMASMFGFPNFVLSKMQPAGDGRFGYWYTDIRLGT